jgi:hypothetical protein
MAETSPLSDTQIERQFVRHGLYCFTESDAIYEGDFLGFSYGFRPKRSQHDALDALAVSITRTKVNWILDVDIRSFFASVSHDWLLRFVKHRVDDPRVIRLIYKWLKAGVMDDGAWAASRPTADASGVLENLRRSTLWGLRISVNAAGNAGSSSCGKRGPPACGRGCAPSRLNCDGGCTYPLGNRVDG